MLTLEEAQELDRLELRPSHVQRYAGAGSPMRAIVGVGGLSCFGTATLLECGHWREIRDYALMPLMGRKRPTKARCGCCRLGYLPRPSDTVRVAELVARLDA
jgi:hypothetical protein